ASSRAASATSRRRRRFTQTGARAGRGNGRLSQSRKPHLVNGGQLGRSRNRSPAGRSRRQRNARSLPPVRAPDLCVLLPQAAVAMLIFRARRALAGALEQPDEARAKRRRVGRGITVGGLLSALKTLFGGGAAIKAVAAAAAAVVVVGESAQHTVVQQHAQA